MRKPNICIIGATGTLGNKLLKYTFNNKIKINCITYFNNKNKALNLKKKNNINNCYSLKNEHEKNDFIKYLKLNKLDIIYFLDFGIESLLYVDIILSKNKGSYIAIANKEMIIAGGPFLIDKIEKTKNILIPLDSEHYSLFNSNIKNNKDNIKKIYITASGGPFYFNKKINLNDVNLKQVLNHPKWKMGVNNSIDSSNFINKLLEIYELSIIYKIDLHKIFFLVSKNAYVHSLIEYKDNTLSLNCFVNDMLITLIRPLSYFFNINLNQKNHEIFNTNNFNIEKFNDKRFKINSLFSKFTKLNHKGILRLVLLNNIAQKRYLNRSLTYNNIIPFINKNLKIIKEVSSFKSFNDILNFVKKLKLEYEKIK